MKTVRELVAQDIDTTEVDIITIYYDKNIIKSQVDNFESLDDEYLNAEVLDYEIEYDTDFGIVYLDITCK